MTPERSFNRTGRLLGALIVAVLTMAVGIQAAIGAQNAKMLGKTKGAPPPMCPETNQNPCSVTGQVTGFQRSANGKDGLFKVRTTGKIVAWSVDLSDPSKEERETFGTASQTDAFGKAPTAGISIIRPTEGKKFKLKSHSPILSMRAFYGRRPTITLNDPLRVRQGDVVALTTATWLPAFSQIGQTSDDAWVASRKQEDWANGERCDIPNSVPPEERLEYFFDHTSPHRTIDSERPYECVYRSARILYWAYFVPSGGDNN
jgi:hypothetical protein